ncbi:DUF6600 domain-containing protein [Prosthecobacter sp.]|jgi:hypothetical protein|uniref:DUF6600 domain-containing protein n=1 Tax=Prosthecobacter sp. TaxID=1965333 RepID=UPI0037838BD8
MKTRLRSLLALAALLSSVSCEKPVAPPASVAPDPEEMVKTQAELAAARDALQRQALEIETRSALMEKQLAEMEKTVKQQENAALRGSLDALRKQNDDLRAQADTARRQSSVIAQKIAPLPRLNSAPVASTPPDYSLFYDRLTPYGRWFDVSGYGYCWRPTITPPRWRPYVDGCWVWSSLGWTWQSNEPFGWATYHYGRWVNLSRYGWVWVPGHEWAPAWVSWRQSRDYVGWAPLPPDRGPCNGVYRDCDAHYNLGPSSYTFITTNHFTQPSYTTVCAPVTRNTTIFQTSVNVTQIVRCDDQPRRNVFKHHGGPPRTQMEQACARQVPQVQVQTASVDQLPQPRPGHHREEALSQPVIVDLPAAKAGVPPVRPQITDRIDKPKRVDAFEGVPQQVAREIRETIAEDKVAAAVQQPLPPVVSSPTPGPIAEVVTRETVRPAIAVDEKATMTTIQTAATETPAETKPEQLPNVTPVVAATPEQPQTTAPRLLMPVQPATVIATEAPAVVNSPVPLVSAETSAQPASVVEKMTAAPPAVEPQAAEAEKARLQAATEQNQREQAEAAAMQQKQQDELAAQQRAAAEKMTAEQAQAAAEAERVRQQAEAAAMQQKQQDELAAQQLSAAEKMALEQAHAVEAERARQQAEAAAMQQRQQEEQMAQQRALAEKMAAEQAQAAAEAERARQQAEAAAMQRQQEEAERRAQETARREAEEQMRRAQEMARQQAEEAARRAQEEQIRQQQEMAQRRAEEQMRAQQEAAQRAAQEMAQRQAEEQARRAAEEQMRRAQEEAQRAAQEAAQRAAEEARRQAEEAARRAAEEAARNQPQPQNPGS